MLTRNVVLTSLQALFVEQRDTAGRDQNSSEVLHEGLPLVERRDSDDEMRLLALREAARIGIAAIESGAYDTFDTTAALNQHLAAIKAELLGAS